MRAFELDAQIDGERHLSAIVPEEAAPGRVRIIVLVPEADDAAADENWMRSVAREWHDELADEQQDIYSLDDGEALRETG